MKKQYTKFRLSEIMIRYPECSDFTSIKDLKDIPFIGFIDEEPIGGDVFHN